MENQKVFGNSLMGFDKKAVIDYIYEQECLYRNQIKDFERQINAHENMIKRVNILEEERLILYRKNSELQSQLVFQTDESKDLKMTNSMMLREIEHLKSILICKDNEITLQMEVHRKMMLDLTIFSKSQQTSHTHSNKEHDSPMEILPKPNQPQREDRYRLPPDSMPKVQSGKPVTTTQFVENVNQTMIQFQEQLKKLK